MYLAKNSLVVAMLLLASSCSLFWRPASYHDAERRKEHDSLVEHYQPAPRVNSPELEPLVPEVTRLLEASPELTKGGNTLLFVYAAEAHWNFERHAVSGVLLRRHAVMHFGWEGESKEGSTCGSSGVRIVQESLGEDRWSEAKLVFNTQDGLWDPRLCPKIHSVQGQQASL